jgi:hypothetical protein
MRQTADASRVSAADGAAHPRNVSPFRNHAQTTPHRSRPRPSPNQQPCEARSSRPQHGQTQTQTYMYTRQLKTIDKPQPTHPMPALALPRWSAAMPSCSRSRCCSTASWRSRAAPFRSEAKTLRGAHPPPDVNSKTLTSRFWSVLPEPPPPPPGSRTPARDRPARPAAARRGATPPCAARAPGTSRHARPPRP